MKKILALLLTVAMTASMAMSLTACTSSGNPNTGTDETVSETSSTEESSKPAAPTGENKLVLGADTELDSNMMGGWSNGSSNDNIRKMIFGYRTVCWTREGEYIFDPQVVKANSSVENADGTKTYSVTILDDLTWNDGTKITAKDYVFQMMLYSSPEFRSTDGGDTETNAAMLVGGKEYYNGKSDKKFAGLHLVDDYTYTVTIKKEELPFYFDITYAGMYPLPMGVIAPGCDITDDGTGAQLTGDFTNELLAKTINTVKTGYRYMPKVTCGPYQLDEYNETDKQATLSINPKFKGTYDGVKPSIQTVVVKKVIIATELDELIAGQVDMLDALPDGDMIETGLNYVDEGKIKYVKYDRAGYGQIQFSCDFGPTQFPEVRQAITYCLDRETFAKQFTKGHGSVVNGPYGLGQPEYKANKKALDEKLNAYSFNVDKAKEILIAGGWTLDKDGKPFDETAKDAVRYKKLDDGTLMPCIIEWCASVNNSVADLLSQMLPDEMKKAGMQLNKTTVEFSVLLEQLYRTPGGSYTEPKYHIFNLATGFTPVPSTKFEYSMDPQYDGDWNNNFIHDQKLADLGAAVLGTAPGDEAKYNENWVNFIVRWNELVPNVPLYANIYHMFMNERVQNFNPNSYWEWGYEMVYASLS